MENGNRTWADLIHENKKAVKVILIFVALLLVTILTAIPILLSKGYNITSTGIYRAIKEPDSIFLPKPAIKPIGQKTEKETIRIPVKVVKYRDVVKAAIPETIKVEKPTVNVSSIGQSGGITAQNVNVGKVVPELTEQLKKSILEVFPDKNEKIDLSYISGPPNSMEFAYKIQSFLESSGYKNINFGMMMAKPEPKGISYDRRFGKARLIVGALSQ